VALAHDNNNQQSFSWQTWLAQCEQDRKCDRIEDTVEKHGSQLTAKQWQHLFNKCEHDSICDEAEDWLEAQGYLKDGDQDHPAAAPEIDPAGAMGALTLLAGGLAALRGRRSGKASR
jgi:hypothetical protein